jgi:GNAT superfamily N-acetyltransferase
MMTSPDLPPARGPQPTPFRFTTLYLDDPAQAAQASPPALPPGVLLRATDAALLAEPESTDLRRAFAALYNAAFQLEPHSPEALDAKSLSQWQQHPLFKPAGIVLAHRGPHLVAAAVGTRSLSVPGDPSRHGAIELVIVHPDYQGQGLGTRLLHELILWLAGQGVQCIVVSTDNSALVRALLHYGFVSYSPTCNL